MLTILSHQVVQADATGIFILALLAAPFIISAIIRKSKISEAEEVSRQYPDGVREVIGWLSSSISYDTAKSIVNNKSKIASAQRKYDEAKRKRAEEKRIQEKASSIRSVCPNVCEGKTDEYIANNETTLRNAQKRYEQRKEEAKTICATYHEGVSAICGYISGFSMTASDIDKVLSNKSAIIAEHQRIEKNNAELAQLTPQLSELKRKYPLGVKEIAREKGWSLRNADEVKLLLLSSGSISEKQDLEEKAILSNQEKLDAIIKSAKEYTERNIKFIANNQNGAKGKKMVIAKNRITTLYGAIIAAKAMESIEAEDRYKAISAFLDSVAKAQNDFALETRKLIPDYFSGWGWYNNEFLVKYTDSIGHSKTNTLKIWQPFCESCCFDDSISYGYYPKYKNNRIIKSQLESTYSYNEKPWSKVLSFINKLKEKYNNELFVVLANTDNLSSCSFENNFKTIKEMLSDAGISYGSKIPQNTAKTSNRTYFILDIIPENSNLVKYCEELFQFRYGTETDSSQGLTRIVYITMLRCFDGSEVEDLNKKAIKANEEKERKAHEEEERKRREAEQKRQDELDISRAKTIARSYPVGFRQFFPDQSTISVCAYEARSIIQRESSIKSFQETLSRMNSCVSSWKLARGVPHWFFYYYYPTRFKDVSMDSQNARRLIYNFKDGLAHDTVKNLVVNKMRSTFSPSDISQMTFVCIPASTRDVHESRYKSFAEDVTQALGMTNAYDYITIVREKTPSHLGGSDSAEYSFSRSFFKGKIVVLFDDVVTSGGSVASMKSTLESLGATVICAFSIGKTYSDWNGNPRQPHPQTGRI